MFLNYIRNDGENVPIVEVGSWEFAKKENWAYELNHELGLGSSNECFT